MFWLQLPGLPFSNDAPEPEAVNWERSPKHTSAGDSYCFNGLALDPELLKSMAFPLCFAKFTGHTPRLPVYFVTLDTYY